MSEGHHSATDETLPPGIGAPPGTPTGERPGRPGHAASGKPAPAGTLRRLAPVAGLFFLAPLVGEFLLGNVPITLLPALPFFALLYGGGALLIREAARRAGRGWPTMVPLAAAYALFEEGPVDQLLWNDSYAGHDYLHGVSYVPALGTSVEVVQTVLALHVVWSMCVPIAIVETFVPRRRTTPWLGRLGLTVTAAVFASGAVVVFLGNYAEAHFVAPPAQEIEAAVVILGLVVLAFRLPSRPVPEAGAPAPSPALVGAAALLVTSAWWGPAVLVTADWYDWAGIALWFLLVVAGVLIVHRWSRRRGWGARHRFALAAGAALTYVWAAFPNRPEADGVPPSLDLTGNVVLGAAAVVVLILAWRVAARSDAAEGK
ncbi:hypothetical protein [Sphaerisporangium fuscum]|uniref:hypothetical protein n=1 Tax=Sphaerisporangium fuscum TaxID=2835868 RepID=UPI001BDCADD4|nr:hypothetical protein [Sphaerisporangium fuscum]